MKVFWMCFIYQEGSVFLMFHRTSWTLIEKVIIFSAVTLVEVRGFFSLKLSPTSGHCPWWLIFFKHLSYQSNCKETVNIGGGQVRGALFNFSVVKKCPFCIFRMLSSVSKIAPGGSFFKRWKPNFTSRVISKVWLWFFKTPETDEKTVNKLAIRLPPLQKINKIFRLCNGILVILSNK